MLFSSTILSVKANDIDYPDSLRVLFQNEKTDSIRIVLLTQAFKHYFVDNIDTSFILSREILELSVKTQDTVQIGQSNLNIASLYNAQGNYAEALVYDRRALDFSSAIDHGTGVVAALNGLGEDYLGLGLFNDAFSYYQQALSKAEEVGDELMSAVVTYNLGRVFKETGQLAKSAEFIRQSMVLSEQINDEVGRAYSLNDLGEIFLLQGEVESALESLQSALTVAEDLDEDVIIPQILINMARCYEEGGQMDIAVGFYDKAGVLFAKQSNITEVAKTNLKKGQVAMTNLDMETAKLLFDKALMVGENQNNAKIIIETLTELSKWYELSDKTAESLQALRRSMILRDSLNAINLDQQFSQTLMEFEIGRKDLAIAELNAQQQLRQQQIKNQEFIRNVLVVILAFTAILLFTLYRNSVKSRKANAKLITHQAEIEAKRKELESLLLMKDKFFSIVSHDLRSPINGLVGILDLLDEGHISQEELIKVTSSLKQRLDGTRKMLDSLLDWALVEMNEITLQWEEVHMRKSVEDNLSFFKEINEKNISFINSISKGLKVRADRNMLDLILRNLIANSIKFMDEMGKVEILSVTNNDTVTISVNDNGVGMAADQISKIFDTNVLYTTKGTANEKGTGLGLKLCKEFVEKMGGTIWVESEEGKGSTFNFTLKKA